MGSIAYASYYKTLLARALLHDGDVNGAAHVIETALAVAELHDDVWWTPELHRLRVLAKQPFLAHHTDAAFGVPG